MSDAGEYTARASNALGVTEAKCVVKVNRKSKYRLASSVFFKSVENKLIINVFKNWKILVDTGQDLVYKLI